jgi:hypothetical protein
MNEEAYMKLLMDWATIFIENGISNPKEIMNSLNKPWSCSTTDYSFSIPEMELCYGNRTEKEWEEMPVLKDIWELTKEDS